MHFLYDFVEFSHIRTRHKLRDRYGQWSLLRESASKKYYETAYDTVISF